MRSLAILLLGMVFATPAIAQQADGNANGTTPGANSTTGTSQATNVVNVQAITGPQTNVPQRQEVEYSGHTYTTPAVGGSYFAGANPCLVGTGAGAAGGPVGFNINIGRNDKDCTRRSDAAAWFALGLPAVAVARLCQDMDKRSPVNADAFFSSTGFACPGSNTTGRYKLADGSLAPYAMVNNQMRFTNASANRPALVDPAQSPEQPVVPNPRPTSTTAPTIPSNPR